MTGPTPTSTGPSVPTETAPAATPPTAVRRGDADDADEILRLRRLIFDAWPFAVDYDAEPGWGERFTATYRELVATPQFAVFVVDEHVVADPASTGDPAAGDPTVGGEGAERRLAACVTVELSRHLPTPGGTGLVAYIADMCTDPAYRGQGLGRLLLETGCAWAADEGASRVELYATESGRALYESDGFRAEGPFVHMGRLLP